jgi:uncharacterized protein (DUF697 family)
MDPMALRDYVRSLFPSEAELDRRMGELRKQTPIPVFWLFGKTQSGKTSIIKYLTGAAEAEIGAGFRPTTRFSRQYQFPTSEAPLLTFLDTRGLDEPGYDAAEDIARFHELAHVVVVTVRIMDHAQERVLANLERIRRDQPQRPVLLVLTCLHEAYPQQQHLEPYPFPVFEPQSPDFTPPPLSGTGGASMGLEDLARSLAEQRRRFGGLVDRMVAVDLTKPEEGFANPSYGGDLLKSALLDLLPAALRQTLHNLEGAMRELRDWHERRAMPYIVGYSSLAGSAGAIPIPWVDLLILPGIQTHMIYQLARLYGQPLTGQRFLELAGTLGIGLVVRQAIREVAKVVPGVGSIAGGALAASSTFALGKAFCFYYSAVLAGHVPQPEEMKKYYHEQLRRAEQLWKKKTSDPV